MIIPKDILEEKSQIDPQTQQIYECLFNSIFIFFYQVLEGKVGLLSIKKNIAGYSIFTENNQNFFTMDQIKKFVQSIKDIKTFDETLHKGVGDLDPVYDFEKNCLYYQPRNGATTIEKFTEGLKQIWPNLSYAKRSNSIKLVVN